MIDFRPVNPERPLAVGDRGREVFELVAINPVGLFCEEALFVNAVTTLGIPLVDYAEIHEEKGDAIEIRLVWRLSAIAVEEASPRYTLSELRKKWHDPAWLAQNPAHELAVARVLSDNLLRFAQRARVQPWLWRVAHHTPGRRAAVFIPCNATEEERQKWLAELK